MPFGLIPIRPHLGKKNAGVTRKFGTLYGHFSKPYVIFHVLNVRGTTVAALLYVIFFFHERDEYQVGR